MRDQHVELAGYRRRLGAFLIDLVFTSFMYGILGYIWDLFVTADLLFTVLFGGIWMAAHIREGRKGQTPGKRLLGIGVINEEGDVPPWSGAGARLGSQGVRGILGARIPRGYPGRNPRKSAVGSYRQWGSSCGVRAGGAVVPLGHPASVSLGQALQHARCLCLSPAPPLARPLERGKRGSALRRVGAGGVTAGGRALRQAQAGRYSSSVCVRSTGSRSATRRYGHRRVSALIGGIVCDTYNDNRAPLRQRELALIGEEGCDGAEPGVEVSFNMGGELLRCD